MSTPTLPKGWAFQLDKSNDMILINDIEMILK